MIGSCLISRWCRNARIAGKILLAGLLLTSCASAANRQVSEVMVCAYNSQYECVEHQPTFSTMTRDIMVNANLDNVVEGTVIGVTWVYLDGELGRSVDIAQTSFRKTDETVTSMYATLNQPNSGWPQGDYEVVLSSDENNVDPVRQTFSIEARNSATDDTFTAVESSALEGTPSPSVPRSSRILGNVTLCQLNEQEDCITEMALLPVNSFGVRIKANVSTAPVGTIVNAQWRYVEGRLGQSIEIETVPLTKSSDSVVWIQSSLKKPEDGWPIGEYEVALSVASDNPEIEVKRFFVQ